MKICILYPSVIGSHSLTVNFDPPYDPTPYLQDHEYECHWIERENIFEQIEKISRRNFDIYLNLCDADISEDYAGMQVIVALETLHLPFTGAGSRSYCLPKGKMKHAFELNSIPTPPYALVNDITKIPGAISGLKFPMIVKPAAGFSSIGLTVKSRVENMLELLTQVEKTINNYGEALIEEFIEGNEYTVLVVEDADHPSKPFVYTPLGYLFPEGENFKHFDLKWKNYHAMQSFPVKDDVLAEKLKEYSAKAFLVSSAEGYARVDLRARLSGEIFVLEVNDNPGVFYPKDEPGSADLILMNEPDGYTHFLNHIFKAAIKRHQLTALQAS